MPNSTITTVHTLAPGGGIPAGFMDEDNIRFIQNKIIQVLKRQFRQMVRIDRASIIRVMERVILERVEAIPMMNQRVIMYLTNEYRNYQLEVDKHLKWEAHYVLSQRLYDPTVEISKYDKQKYKGGDFRGNFVGGTSRFYFT